MGFASTAKNKHANTIFNVSTISIGRTMSIPGDRDKVYVISQAAVYLGRQKPLAAALGKKPIVVIHDVVAAPAKYDVEGFHNFIVRVCQQSNGLTPEEITRTIGKSKYHAFLDSKRQLFYFFRKINFIAAFNK